MTSLTVPMQITFTSYSILHTLCTERKTVWNDLFINLFFSIIILVMTYNVTIFLDNLIVICEPLFQFVFKFSNKDLFWSQPSGKS